ncbi:MAG: molybdopterin-dependent oxidoreductase [Candidatus Aminicenantes bacterium]|nr:molybdopterin-dependent oxidoreductase [Candidatus Aminicenantes bacterium]NIM81994.1 molybdopterin-dependent oxidoreductase [Candidatus Aminicenantes bacterium]NIN21382.1 molybdopterin-dependent oxidoreductase [Candidatus Aminicenantes bacterium]NIN45203.1 molybdopterin-dependent oxidoreductase [Candidatus Aminicenantes bacterium]NIN88020.1 molybdopterin-dependent oxidoreductase [Candidatus Aminicenantes bacterium]
MKMYTTACPRNCYSTCSLHVYLDEENKRICRIQANPDNKATPKGACLRGLSYVERQHSPDRILTPMKRKNSDNGFEPISWHEALDTIIGKIQYIKETFGPQSVLYYYGSGTKGLLNAVGGEFWRLFGGYTTTYGDLCWPAGLEATRLTLGENKHNAPWDIENARLIILWGKNPAETNVQQMRSIDRAVEKGTKLIVIDPRRTISADRAELLIQPRPGTDGALALGMAHVLIKNNTIDHEFIEKYVLGFQEYEQMVLEFSSEKAAEITDVPAAYIHRLAEYIANNSPVSLCPGFGMQRYTNSGQAMRAMMALLAITGNIGKPGAGWLYANLQSSIFDVVKDPIAFFPPEKPDGIVRVSISTSRLGQDMLAQKNPPLKMIWVERGNPITQNPETHTVLKAFRSLDFRVVVEQFFTDTAREADIVLPAKTMFEQSDVIGAYWHPYVQLKQKIIDPPSQVKPESEIYWLLAQRMGFSPEDIADKIPGPTDQEITAFLEKKLEPFPGLSLERLRQGPVLAPGTQEVAFSDFKFPTPSGKIELYSKEASQRWGLDPLPVYAEPMESVRRPSKESKKYPLYFMTPNTKNRTHSQFNNLKLIRQFSPKPVLDMNPEDAAKRGIKAKDKVKVFNDRGSLELEVHIDFSMKSGCVSVTNGWWITDGGTVNFLSFGRETDMGHGAAFHDNLVEVEKIAR